MMMLLVKVNKSQFCTLVECCEDVKRVDLHDSSVQRVMLTSLMMFKIFTYIFIHQP